MAVPASPAGVLAIPDVIIPAHQANPIPVVVQCTNLPLNTEISVVVHPANGPDVQAVGLNHAGTAASGTTTVSLNMPRGGGIIYAKAVTGLAEGGAAIGHPAEARTRPLAETGWTANGGRFAMRSYEAGLETLGEVGGSVIDHTGAGAPREGRIACAINEVNVFSLAAKFAPAGVPSSTELIDVSAFAGQSIELFFGLAGGTAVDCETIIDGIRFVTVPDPKIGIAASRPNAPVKWPAAASGWTLESTDSLTTPDWQPVPLTGVTVESGVATLEQPAAQPPKFYRLRRNP